MQTWPEISTRGLAPPHPGACGAFYRRWTASCSWFLAAVLSVAVAGAVAGTSTEAEVRMQAAGGAVVPFKEILAKPDILPRLRSGGYVLYMRHGTTDNSRADAAVGLSLDDCSTQRVLNDQGRALAVRLGEEMRTARIPVAEIIYSPLCRTTETVRLAFPHFKGVVHPDPDLMYTANLTTAQKQPVLVATRHLVSAAPPPGSNRLIVAHAPNLADLMGYFVKPEGTVVVIKPLGEQGFAYVASIPPALWAELIKAAPAP